MPLFWNIFLKSLGGIIAFVLLYGLAALGLSFIRVNKGFKPPPAGGIDMYILTNGVHTDLVLPLKNDMKDWTVLVNPAHTKSGAAGAQYVAFGWGDKGFYLDTETWADLKFSTAFKAAFYLGGSAMHVTFYGKLRVGESCKKITVSREQYQKLCEYVRQSFETDCSGNACRIAGEAYQKNDAFYEARGRYGLFRTCNTWANSGLKKAGLPASLWTPLDKGIFWQYR